MGKKFNIDPSERVSLYFAVKAGATTAEGPVDGKCLSRIAGKKFWLDQLGLNQGVEKLRDDLFQATGLGDMNPLCG